MSLAARTPLAQLRATIPSFGARGPSSARLPLRYCRPRPGMEAYSCGPRSPAGPVSCAMHHPLRRGLPTVAGRARQRERDQGRLIARTDPHTTRGRLSTILRRTSRDRACAAAPLSSQEPAKNMGGPLPQFSHRQGRVLVLVHKSAIALEATAALPGGRRRPGRRLCGVRGQQG